MKATTYIFGNFADGYSQYPDNYTRNLFVPLSKSRKGATELIYHRDGGLTYYIYTREISRSAKTFIGLCYVFNDILITDFSYLFSIFEDAITNIVVKGEILEFTNDGNVSTKVTQLYTNAEELQRISDYLNSKLSSIGKYAEKLPPRNLAISNTECKTFSYDEIANIITIAKNYSNIRVVKGENYDTTALKGYANKLKSQSIEIGELKNQITNLLNQINILEKKKKQFTVVIILIVIIAVGLHVFAALIYAKNTVIQKKDNRIESLVMHRNRLLSDSTNLQNLLGQEQEKYQNTKEKLDKLQIDYNGLNEEKNRLFTLSEEQKKTIASQKNTISAQTSTINTQTNTIADLERTISNLRNKGNSSSSYTVGASTSHSIGGYDSNYAMWLYATKSVKINYFYVHPNKSGYLTIGLYSSSGTVISSYKQYVYANQWNKISPNFSLNSYVKYYMAIKENPSSISLGYHSSGDSEYGNYMKGYLQLYGAGVKGQSNYATKYYQYFYNINYSL